MQSRPNTNIITEALQPYSHASHHQYHQSVHHYRCISYTLQASHHYSSPEEAISRQGGILQLPAYFQPSIPFQTHRTCRQRSRSLTTRSVSLERNGRLEIG